MVLSKTGKASDCRGTNKPLCCQRYLYSLREPDRCQKYLELVALGRSIPRKSRVERRSRGVRRGLTSWLNKLFDVFLGAVLSVSLPPSCSSLVATLYFGEGDDRKHEVLLHYLDTL